jgi:periplasmic protein TonB
VFDTLLASHAPRAPSTRAVSAALCSHLLLIIAAVTSTASPRPGTRLIARDTIRLEVTEQVKPAPPRGAEPPPSGPEPEIPRPPRVPNILLDAPELQPPVLTFNPLSLPESSHTPLGRDPHESPVSLDSSPSVFSSTEVDQLPELAQELHPHYPDALRRAGVSGLVQVQYVVGSDGMVDGRSVRVLASSHPAFLLAALQALRDARFKPARRAGQPAAVLVQQTIRFRCR